MTTTVPTTIEHQPEVKELISDTAHKSVQSDKFSEASIEEAIKKARETSLQSPEIPACAQERTAAVQQPIITSEPVETSSIGQTVHIPLVKKKKCIALNEDGRKCRKSAVEGGVHCPLHHNYKPKVEPKTIILSKDACLNSLLSLHISTYLLVEAVSKGTKYELDGLLDQLKEDQEPIREIYGNIIDSYTPEELSKYLSPWAGLALISTKHAITARQNAEKKK